MVYFGSSIVTSWSETIAWQDRREVGVRPQALSSRSSSISSSSPSESKPCFTITWQVLPYVLLTFGEVLVATTGLEFAYSQAPLSMKGAIMAFWNLSVTIGNLWVLVANAGVQNSAVTQFITSTGFGVTAFQMFFFAVFAFAAALAFGLVARTYPIVDHYRKG